MFTTVCEERLYHPELHVIQIFLSTPSFKQLLKFQIMCNGFSICSYRKHIDEHGFIQLNNLGYDVYLYINYYTKYSLNNTIFMYNTNLLKQ
jgi:hypothetical protein